MNLSSSIIRLGDYFDVAIGGTPSRKNKEYWDQDGHSDNTWVSIRDISSVKNGRISNSKEQITDLGVSKSNVKLIPKNTAIMTFKLTIGKTAITEKALYTNEAIAAFLPKPNVEADPYYLATILPTLEFDTDQAVKGKTLNKTKIENVLMPLPPVDVQRRIAVALTTIDSAIQASDRTIRKSQKLQQALMQKMFAKNDGNSEPFLSVVKSVSGGTPPKSNTEHWKGDVKWVSPKDMGNKNIHDTRDHISDDAMKYAGITKDKDILIVVRSGVLAHSVPTALVDEGLTFNQDIKALRVIDNKRLDPEYLYYFLLSRKHEILSRAVKRGTTVHSISTDYLNKLLVVIPDMLTQKSIAKVMTLIDDKIDINKRIKAKQELVKTAVLQDLLSGKVHV